MNSVLLIIQTISDFLWGAPMTIALLGTGILLSIAFKFRYQSKMKFHFKNTYAKAFKKGEGEGTVSGFAAACTALANTVGSGNISGVATAVTMGGPGAIFWMWVSGFFGMSIKAAEIIMGQRYRVKYKDSMDEYLCDRSFVMKNAMGWKTGGLILAFFAFIFGPWTCLVQSEAFVSSINEAFGFNKYIILAFLGISVFATIFGGLKRISSIAEKVVPFMAIAYIIGGVVLLALNYDKVLPAFGLIFKSAFTPMAGIGGFAGATVRDSVRYGIARGLYSNDAGTGYGIAAHAAAKTDHPIRQSSWGWGEVFIDTIVICSITALSLVVTNAYIDFPGITSGQLVTLAYKSVFGNAGGYFIALILAIFVWTTIVGMYYSCQKSVNYFFGDTKANKIASSAYAIYFTLPVVFFSNLDVALLWAATDLLSAMYVIITLILIFANRKEIMRLFNDFWDRFVPAIEKGEKVAPVNYGAIDA